MATTSQIVDEVVFETRISDQSTAGVEAAERALGKYDAAAKAAAAASRMLAGVASGAGDGIGAAASSFQQVAGRVDDVTRAYNKLKSAQDTLATAQNAANREIAAGRADMDQVSRTLAELASRVETAAEKLGEARAEATANAEATAAWNGVLAQGAQAMGTFATGVAAQTQAMREEENAARAAAAAQSDLNRILNINVDGKGWKDAATYAQQVAEGSDRLRASISPAFAALQTLDAALAKVANSEKIGVGTTEEWAAARVRANETYAKTMSLLDGTAQKQQQAAAQDAAAAAAATAAFAAIERLQEKWGGEATAVKKSVEAQAEINGLLGAGLISATTAAKAIDGVTEAYRKMSAAAAAAATTQREAVAAQGQSIANQFAATGSTPQSVANLRPPGQENIRQDEADYAARATDIEAYFAALDELRARLVPLSAASQEYAKKVEEAAFAERAGVISIEEGTAAREGALASYRAVAGAIEETARAQREADVARGQSIANQYVAAGSTPQSVVNLRPIAQQNIIEDETNYQKRAADIEAYGNALDAARAKYDPLFRASKQYEAALDEINALLRQGALNSNTAAAARERETAAFAQANAPLREASESLAAMAAASSSAFAAIDQLQQKWGSETTAVRQAIEAQAEINGLLGAGLISAGEAETAIEGVTESYRKMATAAASAALAAAGPTPEAVAKLRPAPLGDLSQDDPSYQRRAADIAAWGAAMDAARAKIDPLFRASKQYEAELDEIDLRVKQLVLTETQATSAKQQATAAFASANAPLKATAENLENVGTSSRNTNTQMALMRVQAVQTFSGLATGQPILTTLIQQLHQVYDSMTATGAGFSVLKEIASRSWAALTSPIGLVVTGIGTVTAAIAALVVSGNNSLAMLAGVQQALRGAQDNYMALGQTVVDVGKKVSQSSGLGLEEAVKAAQTIAQGRYFAGTAADIERLTRDAADLGTKLGGVAAGAKFITDAMLDPAKAAQGVGEALKVYVNPQLVTNIELTQAAQGKGAAWLQLLTLLETELKGTARDGLGPIAKAWQDLGNAVTGTTDSWKPFKEWLANDFALAIQNVTTLINALKDAWHGLKSGLSTEGGLQLPTMPAPTNDVRTDPSYLRNRNSDTSIQVDPEYLRNRSQPVAQPGLTLDGSAGLVTRETNGIRYTVAAEFANQVDGFLRELASSGYAISTVQGFNNRNIAGTDTKSYHAYGAAFDINPAQNPVNGGTDMPPNIREMAARYGLGWGGAWTGGKTDPMHFSFARDEGGAYDVSRSGPIPTLAGGSGAAMLSDTRANADEMKKLVDESRRLKELQLDAEFKRWTAEQERLASTTGKDTTEYKAITQAIEGNRAAHYANVDAMEAQARADQNALAATRGLTEGERALAGFIQQRKQVAEAAGMPFGDAQQQQATLAFLDKQSQAAGQLAADMQRGTDQNKELTASYAQGNQAVGQATAAIQGLNAANKLFAPNSDQAKAAAAGLTEEFKRQAAAAADLKTAQQNSQLRDNLTYIEAETSSLGENENARTKQLAVLKATQDQLREHNGVLTEEAQKYIALTGTIADATAAFQLQQNSLNEVKSFFSNTFDTIGNAITQAFATGNLAALKFKDIAKSVASAVVSEFAKLAVINPLKNLLFGGSDPTLSSVGGILGKLLGGGEASTPVTAIASLVAPTNAALALMGNGVNGPATPESVSTQQALQGGAATASGGGLGLFGSIGAITGLTKLASFFGLTGGGAAAGTTAGGFGQWLSTAISSPASTAAAAITSILGNSAQATNIALSTLTAAPQTGVAVGTAIGNLSVAETAGGAVSGVAAPAQLAGASVANALGASDATAAAISSAAGTVAQALPYIGAAISVITSIARGDYRGAGFAAGGALAGAAIGSFTPLGPGLGTALGAVVGSVISSVFPAHPLHPFDATAVNVQGGQLSVGKTATQAEAANSLGQVQDFVTGINTFMSKAHIILENGNGQLGAIGQGIAGMVGLVTDPNKLLAELRFKNDPSDTSQFGVAKDALRGMTFPNGQALQDEILKIAAFADATEAIGVRLKSVGQDLTGIQISNVEGANPGATGTVTTADGTQIQYLNDLRSALNTDLPQKVFANVQALDDEINSVNQFVGSTLPGLLNPIEKTTSSIMDEVQKVETQYDAAIKQSLQYGLDNTQVLQDAATRAVAIVRASNVQQLNANDVQLRDRLAVATNPGPESSARQALDNFDLQAQQQRDALTKLWTDTFGDTIKTSSDYLNDMNTLEATLGAERLQVVKQSGGAITDAVRSISAETLQGLMDLVSSYAIRIENVTGQTQLAQLTTLNAQADKERAAFVKSFTDAYGDAILADQTFQAQLATVDATHDAERLALLQSFQQAMDQKFAGLQDLVGSIQARGYAATGDQKDADLLNFDIKARQEQASFQQSFIDLYGPAIVANDNYQAQLTTLETVQGEERLAIIKKYADASTAATDAALKTAQGNVTQLFTSLSDYTARLKNSDQNPLSPTAKYDLASSQFNAVAGAAAAGDAKSAGQLTGYSDALLTASRSVYGSGQQYAADFNRVLDAIQNVTMVPDQLTQSFMTLALQTQTQTLVASLQAVQDEIAALRREFANQTRLQSLAA